MTAQTTRWRIGIGLAITPLLFGDVGFAQSPPPQSVSAPPASPQAAAQLMIGGYALVRYISQLPADQTLTDHLGDVNVIRPAERRSSVLCSRLGTG